MLWVSINQSINQSFITGRCSI